MLDMEFAIDTLLLPKLASVMRANPDLHVEFVVDYGLSNIVAERYDAGVHTGEQVPKDMIASASVPTWGCVSVVQRIRSQLRLDSRAKSRFPSGAPIAG
jgi:DNA-binding transcriptional LysR family regulator